MKKMHYLFMSIKLYVTMRCTKQKSEDIINEKSEDFNNDKCRKDESRCPQRFTNIVRHIMYLNDKEKLDVAYHYLRYFSYRGCIETRAAAVALQEYVASGDAPSRSLWCHHLHSRGCCHQFSLCYHSFPGQ